MTLTSPQGRIEATAKKASIWHSETPGDGTGLCDDVVYGVSFKKKTDILTMKDAVEK